MAFSGIVLICYFFFLGFNFSSLYARIVVEEPLPENWTLQANGYIEPKCASKYKDIKSVRPDGQPSSPFLKFESPQGVSLQCDADIPNGKLLRCDYIPPYVGTQCAYNCNAGYLVTSTNVTCRLMKPFENVTAKWWAYVTRVS
ncbi:hypothetical protein Btru_039695 [Bulinus truncatus]|nr:hypothetical protein Btru_039695 [Bulinus truncatus]